MFYLPEYIAKAFRKEDIKSGWLKSGLYPVDTVKILKYWPEFDSKFKNIHEGNGDLDRFLNAIKKLSSIGYVNGFITDKNIINHTEDIIPTAASKKLFDFERLEFNRWRAAWMNNTNTLQKRAQLKQVKDEAENKIQLKKRKKLSEKKDTNNEEIKIKHIKNIKS
jgi:hypothetical protein